MVKFFKKESEFEDLSFGKPIKGNDGRYFIGCFVRKDNEPLEEIVCQFSKQLISANEIVTNGGTDFYISDEETIEFIKECDDKMLELCKINKEEWFPGKDISDEYVEQAFMSSLSNVKKQKNTIKFKTRTSKELTIFNSAKEIINIDEVTEGTKLGIIVQLAGLWFTTSRFGITWKLRQGKLIEKVQINKFGKSLFNDDDEEMGDDDDMNVFPDT
tara:strand:+ start:501 stop:1145 length:645 start_codon:yes stop_codon:yes gene_type:complete